MDNYWYKNSASVINLWYVRQVSVKSSGNMTLQLFVLSSPTDKLTSNFLYSWNFVKYMQNEKNCNSILLFYFVLLIATQIYFFCNHKIFMQNKKLIDYQIKILGTASLKILSLNIATIFYESFSEYNYIIIVIYTN